MYGTVARLRIKPGKEAELERLSRDEQNVIPGIVFQYVYRMDTDSQDLYLAMLELLEREPEWNDGEIVYSVNS